MEGLTIEQKAKRFDEAIKRAKDVIEQNPLMEYLKKGIEYIFPELKENEDEGIRKALINGFNKLDKSAVWYNGVTNGQILDWLEKQGEQKHADKVKPKFKVGDWIVTPENKVLQITSIEGTSYRFNNESHYWEICYCDEQCHLWTIEDAKEGDVLTDGDMFVIFKSNNYDPNTQYGCMFVYCSMMKNNSGWHEFWYESGGLNPTYYLPANKEQRDFLFQKMKEAGYMWDAENKELKKTVAPIFKIGDIISKKHNSDINKFGQFTITDITGGKYWYNDRIICNITEQNDWEIYKQVRQNLTWSEEDEKFVHGLIRGLAAKRDIHGHTTFSSDCIDITETINFLGSLKDRVQSQSKPEWSEEDNPYYDDISEILINLIHSKTANVNKDAVQKDLDWFISLKGRIQIQPQLEWSEEDEQYLLVCKNALRKYQVTDKWDSNIISQWLDSKLKSLKLQPKNEWSGEDDYNLQCLIAKVTSDIQKGNIGRNNELIDWLKSIRDRVTPKQEILEKLEEWLDEYISNLADVGTDTLIGSFRKYLDGKLPVKPKSQWKPTKQQLIELRHAISGCSFEVTILVELEEQLKKLL